MAYSVAPNDVDEELAAPAGAVKWRANAVCFPRLNCILPYIIITKWFDFIQFDFKAALLSLIIFDSILFCRSTAHDMDVWLI